MAAIAAGDNSPEAGRGYSNHQDAQAAALRNVYASNNASEKGAAGGTGKAFSKEKEALVDMANADKNAGGVTPQDMQAYKDLNKRLSDPFPKNQVRGPETHKPRTPESTPGPGQKPHGHVGPVGHIPIEEKP